MSLSSKQIEYLKALPADAASELLKLKLQEKYKSSLYLTAKYLLGYKDITHYTHDNTIAKLEAPSTRKLIVLPRGTFKSSLGSVAFPIWLLMRNPNLRILIDSEVYTNSKNFLREIRGHLESSRFTNLFGQWRGDTWSEGEITVNTRTLPKKEASITCGGIGTVKVGQHYDVIIGDDYNSDNNSATSEGRRTVVRHYQMNISILDPGGIYLIIGTRYAIDDIPGFIIENEIQKKGMLPS